MDQGRLIVARMPARTAKRASNYWRDRRVIRALMFAGSGLLAARTKRTRERERELPSARARRWCCGLTKKTMTRGTKRNNKGRDDIPREVRSVSVEERREKKTSRYPCGEGKRHYHRALIDLWSRYQFFSAWRSRSDAILLERRFPRATTARRRLLGSEERLICTADLSVELLI